MSSCTIPMEHSHYDMCSPSARKTRRFASTMSVSKTSIPIPGRTEPYFFYRYQQGRPVLNINGEERRLVREVFESDESILAQRRDPEAYPEVSYLTRAYEKIRVYREWTFGRNTVFREPQKADMRNDRLEEDFSNLGLFLNRLRRTPKAKNAILEALRGPLRGF